MQDAPSPSSSADLSAIFPSPPFIIPVGGWLLGDSYYVHHTLRPPPDTLPEFTDETRNLVKILHLVHQFACGAERVFSPVASLWFFNQRLFRPFQDFKVPLQNLYDSPPTFRDEPIRSFHEFAISTAGEWMNAFMRFITGEEFNRLQNLTAFEDLESFWIVPIQRFKLAGRTWPFKVLELKELLLSVELEGKRAEHSLNRPYKPIEPETKCVTAPAIRGGAVRKVKPKNRRRTKKEIEALRDRAIILIAENPELENTEIATKMGVDPAFLSRPNDFVARQEKIRKASMQDIERRASIDGRTGNVEFYDRE